MENRKGFTLIELLIVVVIIGILAAIAIPKFSATRERAYRSAMQSDLRNLQTSQEIWYADPVNNYSYTDALEAAPPAGLGFNLSSGIVIESADVTADGNGWSVTLSHEALGGVLCGVYVGEDTPAVLGIPSPGVVMCDDEVAAP